LEKKKYIWDGGVLIASFEAVAVVDVVSVLDNCLHSVPFHHICDKLRSPKVLVHVTFQTFQAFRAFQEERNQVEMQLGTEAYLEVVGIVDRTIVVVAVAAVVVVAVVVVVAAIVVRIANDFDDVVAILVNFLCLDNWQLCDQPFDRCDRSHVSTYDSVHLGHPLELLESHISDWKKVIEIEINKKVTSQDQSSFLLSIQTIRSIRTKAVHVVCARNFPNMTISTIWTMFAETSCIPCTIFHLLFGSNMLVTTIRIATCS
jgi:hypothetical protein